MDISYSLCWAYWIERVSSGEEQSKDKIFEVEKNQQMKKQPIEEMSEEKRQKRIEVEYCFSETGTQTKRNIELI